MKFSRQRFMYTFNGSANMTTNMKHNHANEQLDLHKFLIEWVKLKYVQFDTVGFFFNP